MTRKFRAAPASGRHQVDSRQGCHPGPGIDAVAVVRPEGGGPRWRRGQSLVEFALLLPVLTMLLAGAIDFGRVFYSAMAVTNASRVAAEMAANPGLALQYQGRTVSPNPCVTGDSDETCGQKKALLAVKQAAVQEAGTVVPLTTDDVTVTFQGTAWQPGTKYTVAVTANFAFATPLASTLFGNGSGAFRLTRTTEMRHMCSARSACTYA